MNSFYKKIHKAQVVEVIKGSASAVLFGSTKQHYFLFDWNYFD